MPNSNNSVTDLRSAQTVLERPPRPSTGATGTSHSVDKRPTRRLGRLAALAAVAALAIVGVPALSGQEEAVHLGASVASQGLPAAADASTSNGRLLELLHPTMGPLPNRHHRRLLELLHPTSGSPSKPPPQTATGTPTPNNGSPSKADDLLTDSR